MLSTTEIDGFKGTDSRFIDYEHFEDESTKRRSAQEAFIRGDTYAPGYDYPKLKALFDLDDDGKFLQEKKTETYHAVLELEANKDSGAMPAAEFELYTSFHELRLKRIMLIEAARRMSNAGSSSEQMTAREEFMQLNEELYGEFDVPTFEGMMNTEKARLDSFVPANEKAASIKSALEHYFDGHIFESTEKPLLDDELFNELASVVRERYADVFAVVPDTLPDVYYDAEQCRQIMQDALERGGLAEHGWIVEISKTKSNPSTDVNTKKIFLPSSTRRNAGELRRLIVHEQEVHARRGQNGIETGLEPLKDGTADYADVEEGLGVLLECIVAGNMDNPSYHRARERYITAGLALGADGIPRDARQTFEILWRMLAVQDAKEGMIDESLEESAKQKAMKHLENAFRGTNFAMPGIIFTKLKVYYEGLAKNASYFTEHRHDINGALDKALVGKHNHVDPDESAKVHQLVSR